jgi:very-long-chain (3R)-3-hydroxyacyl-CoA dehydratase
VLKRETGNAPYVQYYLIAYNTLSAIGWAYVFFVVVVHIFNLDGASDKVPPVTGPTASSKLSSFLSAIPFLKSTPIAVAPSFFESKLPAFARPLYHRATTSFGRVGATTAFVQTFAVLEIVHVLLGFVRSALPTTLLQVFSRVYLVWGIAEQYPAVC